MENYKIVADEARLKEFIEWLPNLTASETFYVSLFARKKYCVGENNLKADKAQLKRFLSTKEYLFDKIKQLECEFGSYKESGQPIQQESLALYIMPNPRCHEKVAKEVLKDMANKITAPYNGYNVHASVMSEYQKTASRKVYIDFDYDNVDYNDVVEIIKDKINFDTISIVKTRGGFHILVETGKVHKQYAKSWYNSLCAISGCDMRGDNLLPVVGCYQGGFVPYFINV